MGQPNRDLHAPGFKLVIRGQGPRRHVRCGQHGPNHTCGSEVARVRALQLLVVRLALEGGAVKRLLADLAHDLAVGHRHRHG